MSHAASAISPLQVYNALLSAVGELGNGLQYIDNLSGRIVWNEAQFMESLVHVYHATRDTRYLDMFVEHGTRIIATRDDRAGQPDTAGSLRLGWQVGSYYTLGMPLLLYSRDGAPTLEVQGIHRAGNNHTTIEVEQEGGNSFGLIVRNDFRRSSPVEIRFAGLTTESAERVINSTLTPDDWIRVHVVGSAPPVPGVFALEDTQRAVLHEMHTPVIGVPFMMFVVLVLSDAGLQAYGPAAAEFLAAFEESFEDYASSWRQDGEEWSLDISAGSAMWASGLEAPYNSLSANGRFALWLWRATGKPEYLVLAAGAAAKVRAGMTFRADGTMTMPYWVKGSLPYTGGDTHYRDERATPYSRIMANPTTEDSSHFCLTLRFMVDAFEEGLAFVEGDLRAVAQTFVKRLWKPASTALGTLCDIDQSRGFFIAQNLDGRSRAYDYAAATFVTLRQWEPAITACAYQVYSSRYVSLDCIDKDYLLGEVLLGWSLLAQSVETP